MCATFFIEVESAEELLNLIICIMCLCVVIIKHFLKPLLSLASAAIQERERYLVLNVSLPRETTISCNIRSRKQ